MFEARASLKWQRFRRISASDRRVALQTSWHWSQVVHECDMRVCSSSISNQQKLIGGLVASAVLAFVVAFAKVRFQSNVPSIARLYPLKPTDAPLSLAVQRGHKPIARSARQVFLE